MRSVEKMSKWTNALTYIALCFTSGRQTDLKRQTEKISMRTNSLIITIITTTITTGNGAG
ncbi:thr operon leader peptide [Pantoea sp. Acro-835]|uniref:thr operon leader peptide n=2 Tax=Candidatus Pantoea multigeneris TaxID=2608357 RepID=A0ABX0RAX1_9GAMM|nr:thr operon leader peptide [Pantoea multigeneris]